MTQTGDQGGFGGLDSPVTAPEGTLRQALIEHLTALQARDTERFSAPIGNEVAELSAVACLCTQRRSTLEIRIRSEYGAGAAQRLNAVTRGYEGPSVLTTERTRPVRADRT